MDPKKYISVTEIARGLARPEVAKEIIRLLINDGTFNDVQIENGEFFFERKYLEDIRDGVIHSVYYHRFLETGEFEG